MRKNATKLAAAVLSLAMVMTSVSMPASAAKKKTTKINKSTATLYTNGSKSQKSTTLYVTVGGKKVKATFKSSNTKILTVAKKTGKVTAKKPGKATVTATYKKKNYKCTVTVKAYATSVKVSPTSVNLVKGKTKVIKATVSPSNASNKKVSFSSSNKAVATVSSTGKITAKKAGTAKITVTALGSKNDAKKAYVTVKVTNPAPAPTETPVVTETPAATVTPVATVTPSAVATEGTITITSNATGASVKIVTGAAVVAEGTISENGSFTTATKLPVGTYTVTVSKIGYKEVTKTVVVDKDIVEAINLEEVPSVDNAVSAIDNVKVYIDKALKVIAKEDVIIDGKPAKEITVRKDGSVIATAAENMTPGSKYEVKVLGATYSIVAKPADSVALKLVKAEALSCTVVRVELDGEDGDDLSVKDPANYVFDNGLKAVSVEYAKKTDGNFDKSVALVTTTMQTDGQAYTLKIDGIADFSGNVAKDTKANFAGIGEDKTAPELVSAMSSKGNTVDVVIKDASLLTEETLGNKLNYSIDGLTIEKAVITSNVLGKDKEKKVTLFTSTQTPTKIYTLKVGNIADIYGNKMTKTAEVQFAGTELDKKAPNVVMAEAKTNTRVDVTFDDSLDEATAQNPANYKIPGLTVTAAKIYKSTVDETYNGKRVILTTSAQTAGTVYEVSVSGVKDAAGNVITTSDVYTAKFAGVPVDTIKPGIVNVTSTDKNKIVVTFDEDVDDKTASNPLNYCIDNNLGYATAVKFDGFRTATLTTATQEAGKVYTLTVNSVKDLSDNVIATDAKSTFVGLGEVAKEIKLTSAVALNNRQVQISFNKAIVGDIDKSCVKINKNNGTGTALDIHSVTTVNNKTFIVTIDEQFERSAVYTIKVADENVLKASGTNKVTDLCGNTMTKISDTIFGGITADASKIKMTTVTQVSDTTLRVTFSQKVKVTNQISDVKLKVAGKDDLTGTIAAESSAVDSVLVVFTKQIPKKVNATLEINATDATNVVDAATGIFNMANTDGQASTFNFGTGEYETSVFKMTHAQAIDNRTIDVEYNNEIKLAANVINGVSELKDNYDICAEGSETPIADIIASAKKIGPKKVRIYLKDSVAKDYKSGVFYVKTKTTTVETALVTDLDGCKKYDAASNAYVNAEYKEDNLKAKFAMSSVNHDAAKLLSAQVLDDNHLQVVFSEAIDVSTPVTGDAFRLYRENSSAIPNAFASTVKCVDEDAVAKTGSIFVLGLAKGAFVKDAKYSVALATGFDTTDANKVNKVAIASGTNNIETNPIKLTFGGISKASTLLTAKKDGTGQNAVVKVVADTIKETTTVTYAACTTAAVSKTDVEKAGTAKSVNISTSLTGTDIFGTESITKVTIKYVTFKLEDGLKNIYYTTVKVTSDTSGNIDKVETVN